MYKPLPKDDPRSASRTSPVRGRSLGWEPKVDRSEGLRSPHDYFKSLSPRTPREEHNTFEGYVRKVIAHWTSTARSFLVDQAVLFSAREAVPCAVLPAQRPWGA